MLTQSSMTDYDGDERIFLDDGTEIIHQFDRIMRPKDYQWGYMLMQAQMACQKAYLMRDRELFILSVKNLFSMMHYYITPFYRKAIESRVKVLEDSWDKIPRGKQTEAIKNEFYYKKWEVIRIVLNDQAATLMGPERWEAPKWEDGGI